MRVKELIEWLQKFDKDLEVFIRNSVNICGNISELSQIEKTTYGFFGTDIDCVVFNSANSANDFKLNEIDDYVQYIETSGRKLDNNKITRYQVNLESEKLEVESDN